MKRKISCIVMAVFLLATGVLSSCKGDGDVGSFVTGIFSAFKGDGDGETVRLPEPEQIILNAEALELLENETFELRISDEELFWTQATYSSSDSAVATVDKNGVITAISAGQTTINVTLGERSSSVAVTVKALQKTYALTLDKKDMKIGVGSNVTINASVLLWGEVTQDVVTWSVVGGETQVEYSTNGNVLFLNSLPLGIYTVTATFGDLSESIEITATESGNFMDYPTDQNATVAELMAVGFANKDTNWATKEYFNLWRVMTVEDYDGAAQTSLYYNVTNGITAEEKKAGTTSNVGVVVSPELLKSAVDNGMTHVTLTWDSRSNSHTVINQTTLSGVKSGSRTFALSDLKVNGEYALSIRTHGAWWCAYLYVSSLVFTNPMADLLTDALTEGTELAREKFIPLWEQTAGSGIITTGAYSNGVNTYGEGQEGILFSNVVEAYLSSDFIEEAIKAGYTKLTIKTVVPNTANGWWLNAAVFSKNSASSDPYGKKVIISGQGYTTEKSATVTLADIMCDGAGYFPESYVGKYCLKVWTANAGTAGYITSLKLSK